MSIFQLNYPSTQETFSVGTAYASVNAGGVLVGDSTNAFSNTSVSKYGIDLIQDGYVSFGGIQPGELGLYFTNGDPNPNNALSTSRLLTDQLVITAKPDVDNVKVANMTPDGLILNSKVAGVDGAEVQYKYAGINALGSFDISTVSGLKLQGDAGVLDKIIVADVDGNPIWSDLPPSQNPTLQEVCDAGNITTTEIISGDIAVSYAKVKNTGFETVDIASNSSVIINNTIGATVDGELNINPQQIVIGKASQDTQSVMTQDKYVLNNLLQFNTMEMTLFNPQNVTNYLTQFMPSLLRFKDTNDNSITDYNKTGIKTYNGQAFDISTAGALTLGDVQGTLNQTILADVDGKAIWADRASDAIGKTGSFLFVDAVGEFCYNKSDAVPYLSANASDNVETGAGVKLQLNGADASSVQLGCVDGALSLNTPLNGGSPKIVHNEFLPVNLGGVVYYIQLWQ